MKEEVRKARWFAVLAATGLALYVCWLMLKPFLAVLEWSVVLVIVFYPVHRRLGQLLKRPRLTALLSSLLVIVVIVLPLGFLTAMLVRELTEAMQTLPQLTALFDPQSPGTAKFLGWIERHLNLSTHDLQQLIAARLSSASGSVLNQTLGMLGNLLSGILQAIFIVFTMYYLFRDGHQIVSALPGVLPLRRKQSEAILARTVQVISASVYGVVAIAMIQGALGGLAFWVLGVPSPLLWGVLLAFVCMIPVAGSFMVWVPAAIYLGFTGHWAKALVLVLWGAFVISTIDNFLRPRLIRQYTQLHELLVFFSVLGGMKVFGLLGIVLGPVVLAITIGLLNTFRSETEESTPA